MLYKNLNINEAGHLTFAGYDTTALAKEYGTPLMLLDEMSVRARCREYKNAMKEAFPEGSMPLYASKALSFKHLYEIMAQENMGIDVVSSGELRTAVKAGFPMENAYFHGNAKTDEDIRFAIANRIGYFVCDNADELAAIDREAGKAGLRQKILLRLSPGIDPHTHAKISTGKIDCKFGAVIENGQAERLILQALSCKNVELRGYHCHIGSQIFDHAPFCEAAVMMLTFLAQIKEKHGFCAPVLNLGGGMGVPYTKDEPAIDYGENIRKIGLLVSDTCKELGIPVPVILMEPGRSIVADSGMTLYTVSSTKEIPGFKNYVSVDGGMTDNPRYTLYEAPYTVLSASRVAETADFPCTLAGRCCESGDLIQENVTLPAPRRGDLVAVLTTGAYNYAMSSNYNRIPRPPIVMIGENGPYTAVRRETLDDLLSYDL